jgi:hypothetical protein
VGRTVGQSASSPHTAHSSSSRQRSCSHRGGRRGWSPRARLG